MNKEEEEEEALIAECCDMCAQPAMETIGGQEGVKTRGVGMDFPLDVNLATIALFRKEPFPPRLVDFHLEEP